MEAPSLAPISGGKTWDGSTDYLVLGRGAVIAVGFAAAAK